MVNDVPKRRLKLKDTYNNTYDADEILMTLKDFENTPFYAGAETFACRLLGIKPERIWAVFEYVEGVE